MPPQPSRFWKSFNPDSGAFEEAAKAPEFYTFPGSQRKPRKGPGPVLMAWGGVVFAVWPLNFDEWDHETASDWATKEIAGASIYREWVGEEDEIVNLRGRIYPYSQIGGLPEIELLETRRRSGTAEQIVRADGRVMGWFVCERLTRVHTNVGPAAIGQVVEFEAVFARVPVPNGEDYWSKNWYRILWGSV
jgi:phage protein U